MNAATGVQLIAAVSLAAWLTGCASTGQSPTGDAADEPAEKNYVTGSNIPKREPASKLKVSVMEDKEKIRESLNVPLSGTDVRGAK
ncbi:hypothetical protein RQP53_07575 [Paucibacter sp. APW11]|uniref:Uncharacterized protein n=1 Tax=Roseateles aquae TaxID=3077235 RepID=A0ABU3P983_9BURK|nr:hypothetical protein [Paucibacter sp. APW11]MDT8999124.1 hypothetical protein [Paucibacter sp. APW11]